MPTSQPVDLQLDSAESLRQIVDLNGPVATVVVPIDRHGIRAPLGPTRLRLMITQVERALKGARLDGGPITHLTQQNILKQLSASSETEGVWSHPHGSVFVIAGPHQCAVMWSPISLAEGFIISPRVPGRLLASAVYERPDFNLLDLSLNTVRLRIRRDSHLVEVPLPAVARSFEAALSHEDHERHLTNHTAGTNAGHDMRFHGHGIGGEIDAARVERFIRVVDESVTAALREIGRDHLTLVVRAATEHLPVLRAVSTLKRITASPVAGSPDDGLEVSLDDLEGAVFSDLEASRNRQWLTDMEQSRSNGTFTDDAGACLVAAREGRVAALTVARLAGPSSSAQPTLDLIVDPIDNMVLDVVAHGGTVMALDQSSMGTSTPTACILRF